MGLTWVLGVPGGAITKVNNKVWERVVMVVAGGVVWAVCSG